MQVFIGLFALLHAYSSRNSDKNQLQIRAEKGIGLRSSTSRFRLDSSTRTLPQNVDAARVRSTRQDAEKYPDAESAQRGHWRFAEEFGGLARAQKSVPPGRIASLVSDEKSRLRFQRIDFTPPSAG